MDPMRNKAAERTVAQFKEPLAQVCAHLAPHLSKIQASWHKALGGCAPCNKHASLLSVLHLPQQVKALCNSDASAWRMESEEQGRELARQGVPAECLGVAILLYVESCIPHLASEDPRMIGWLRAMLSCSRLHQYFLLSGYARQSVLDVQALDDRVDAAERRYREFSVKLGDAYENERRRLARDLHDEIGHDLIVLKLYIEIISRDLKKGDLPQIRGKLKESVSLIKHLLGGVRNLVFDLGPTAWHEQGFLAAVRTHVRQFGARTGLKVQFDARRLRTPLPARYESALYKVLQGALANIAAHASASRVKIKLAASRNCVVMKIEDEGKGFDVGFKTRPGARSYGLRAMRDRVELLGGKIQVISRRAGPDGKNGGTTILCNLPLQNSETG
jgi:signal transduction histidine kinase